MLSLIHIFVYKMKKATDGQAGGEYTCTVSLAAAKDLGYTIESDGSYTCLLYTSPRRKDVRLPNGKKQIGNNLCTKKH